MRTSVPIGEVDDETAVLVIRVWTEPHDPRRLRARLVDVAERETAWAVSGSVDDVCDAVRDWLARLTP